MTAEEREEKSRHGLQNQRSVIHRYAELVLAETALDIVARGAPVRPGPAP